jgi:hypothetical protein
LLLRPGPEERGHDIRVHEHQRRSPMRAPSSVFQSSTVSVSRSRSAYRFKRSRCSSEVSVGNGETQSRDYGSRS